MGAQEGAQSTRAGRGLQPLRAADDTPETSVSADLSDDKRMLLVHSLDVDDEQELVRSIQTRYEAPLLEVFACSRT